MIYRKHFYENISSFTLHNLLRMLYIHRLTHFDDQRIFVDHGTIFADESCSEEDNSNNITKRLNNNNIIEQFNNNILQGGQQQQHYQKIQQQQQHYREIQQQHLIKMTKKNSLLPTLNKLKAEKKNSTLTI